MGDDSAPGGFSGFIEKLKKWFVPFIAVALFVFGLPKVVKEAQENITWVVAAAVVVGALFLYWVYTSETEREGGEATDPLSKLQKVPRFSNKLRGWAFAGMILLPVLTIFGFVVAEYIKRRPSNKIIVLVADFQGPDQKDPVTPAVINKLRLGAEEFSAEEFLEVEIKGLGMTITEQEGSATAREKGKEKKASIVIWGSYDVALTGAVHIETLGEQRQLTSQYISARTSRYVGERASRYVGRRRGNGEQIDYSASVVNNPGLTVKESLSGDMSLITLLLAGFIYYESEDYDKAIRRFSRALEQKTSAHSVKYQSDLLFFRGISFSFKGDFDSAISDYDQAVKLKPDDADIYKYRGDAYSDKGRHDQAIADYDLAIKLKPDYADAYNNRGNAYSDKGRHDLAIADYDQAIAGYNQVIKLKPDDALAYNSRGNVYSNKGRLDQAIADYYQAIKLEPDDALAYINSGNAYHDKGELDRAIANFDHAIKLKPDDALVYNNRGNVYYDNGQIYQAIADYDRAIKLKPDYADAYNNRGDAYFAKGYNDRVLAAYDKAIADHDRAISDYDQAIKLKPDYAYAYNGRGIVYDDHGRYDRAIADYDQAIKLKPDYADAYINRGIAYRNKEQLDRAIADYDQAIKLESDYALAYYHRGNVYEKAGNKQSAIADFRKSLELYTDPRDRKGALDSLRSLGVKAE
jgi:tetratricopeptide (TPR) repeat protein